MNFAIGDQYKHEYLGVGTIAWINPNINSKYPIKIHFKDYKCHCFFNENGMQYAYQKIPLIHFPNQSEPVLSDCSKWDKRFIELAEHIAQWSKDPSTKVGAVIVDNIHRIVSLGFNGYPQHVPDDDLHIRENKYAKILHAEMNALLFAQRDLSSCRLYVWPMLPCSRCASAIIQSGIIEVVTVIPNREVQKRWEEKNEFTEDMFENANVTLRFLK